MYRLKLIMTDGHSDQRIDLRCRMQIDFPVCQLSAEHILTDRRSVDDLALSIIAESRAGNFAYGHIDTFDLGADDLGCSCVQRVLLESLKTVKKSAAVSQGLFCRRISVCLAP